jgi:glycosyltransferase involved in cell wall biosynthesis
MRVCLDASSLQFPPSGIRTYVDALIAEFSKMPGEIDLSLVDRSVRDGTVGSRVPERLSRFSWDVSGVSRAAHASDADILHVPQFSAPWKSGQRLVVTIHDLIPLMMPEYRDSKPMRVYLHVMQRTVQRAAAIIVPSEYVAMAVTGLLGIERERIHVIPMAAGPPFIPAVDLDSMPSSLKRLGIDRPYVFNIAGFDARKNLGCLLEAFAQFNESTGRAYTLVIGGAPHTGNPVVFPPVMPEIERLGLRGQVILSGVVAEPVKIALYQHATMYVTPSLQEGFGMTCLEAMACGVPVIAADRASLPEVIGDGGLLVPPEPDAVAGAMLGIDRLAELAESLRSRGLAQAAQFSWASTARMTVEAYGAALVSGA